MRSATPSLRSYWLSKTPAERTHLLSLLSPDELEFILHDWRGIWARPEQLAPPPGWRKWFIKAGRGFGKTRSAAEYVNECAEAGRDRLIALIAPTIADVRDTMIEGESGLLACSRPGFRPVYEPSKRRVTWPNGVRATTFSAYTQEDAERLRGPQHHLIWAEEIASWRRPEAWDMAMFGLRLGGDPRAVVTGTPKPVRLVKQLLADPQCKVTGGSTYDNLHNLAEAFAAEIIGQYEGTRLGRQELDADLLDDNPDALWRRDKIDELRVRQHPDLVRLVVAVDPPGSSGAGGAECGIVAAGKDALGHAYVLDDASLRGTPEAWAGEVIVCYHRNRADLIVGEANYGGEMVGYTIQATREKGTPDLPYKVVHATRGKALRAEPISALYERNLVHHVGGFPKLEDELCEWVAGQKSPNRLDALVWALTELMLAPEEKKLPAFRGAGAKGWSKKR